jgi:hypothetical protein
MKYTYILFPAMAAAALQGQARKGKGGNAGSGTQSASSAAAAAPSLSATAGAAAGTTAAAGASSNSGGGKCSQPFNHKCIAHMILANNAGAAGTKAANGLLQLPNPGPNLPVPLSFTPVSTAVPGTSTVAQVTNAQAKAALQAAADNWSFDTGMVSNFLNTGAALAGTASKEQAAANIGYNAEVDELAHKAILDQIIGNDPDVSIANQTLTNGCFQSVVDNLQILAAAGGPAMAQTLINNMNKVRCTQVLPSIDTYLAVAARVIGNGAPVRTAIRPDACAAIVAAAPNSAFPGNLKAVNVRANTNKVTNGQSFAGTGTPSVQAPPNQPGAAVAAGAAAPAASGTTGTTTGGTTTTGGKKGAANPGTASGAAAASAGTTVSSSSSVAAAPASTATSSTTGATTSGTASTGKKAGKKASRFGGKARRSMAFQA